DVQVDKNNGLATGREVQFGYYKSVQFFGDIGRRSRNEVEDIVQRNATRMIDSDGGDSVDSVVGRGVGLNVGANFGPHSASASVKFPEIMFGN
ncbi:hypothetical protein L249_5498, partial [Ophiocordyceps polyrhachis-furcata BCC 54312]